MGKEKNFRSEGGWKRVVLLRHLRLGITNEVQMFISPRCARSSHHWPESFQHPGTSDGREQSLGKHQAPALTAKPREKLTRWVEVQDEHGFAALKKTVISFQSFWKSIIWARERKRDGTG